MDEIRMIASEPKDTHARNVSDYSALTTIVNQIIDETCEAGMYTLTHGIFSSSS